MVKIELGGNEKDVQGGLRKVSDFYEELGIEPTTHWLYLDKSGDIDVPLLSDDHIIIHGGEKIVMGDINSQIGENPTVRNPIHVTFNGKKVEREFKKAKIDSNELCRLDEALESPRLFADLEGKVDAFIKSGLTLILQNSDSYFTIPSGEADNDVIDLEDCSKNERKPPKGQKFYKIRIDGNKYKVEKQKMTGNEILSLVGKNYEEWALNRKFRGGRRKPIEPESLVDFTEPGIERFETVRRQAQQGVDRDGLSSS